MIRLRYQLYTPLLVQTSHENKTSHQIGIGRDVLLDFPCNLYVVIVILCSAAVRLVFEWASVVYL